MAQLENNFLKMSGGDPVAFKWELRKCHHCQVHFAKCFE